MLPQQRHILRNFPGLRELRYSGKSFVPMSVRGPVWAVQKMTVRSRTVNGAQTERRRAANPIFRLSVSAPVPAIRQMAFVLSIWTIIGKYSKSRSFFSALC